MCAPQRPQRPLGEEGAANTRPHETPLFSFSKIPASVGCPDLVRVVSACCPFLLLLLSPHVRSRRWYRYLCLRIGRVVVVCARGSSPTRHGRAPGPLVPGPSVCVCVGYNIYKLTNTELPLYARPLYNSLSCTHVEQCNAKSMRQELSLTRYPSCSCNRLPNIQSVHTALHATNTALAVAVAAMATIVATLAGASSCSLSLRCNE